MTACCRRHRALGHRDGVCGHITTQGADVTDANVLAEMAADAIDARLMPPGYGRPLARALTATLEQLVEVTRERDAAIREHRRVDEALGRAERRYERREEQIDDIAASIGCERGWTSMHGHETCIDEAIAALRARADTAERGETLAKAVAAWNEVGYGEPAETQVEADFALVAALEAYRAARRTPPADEDERDEEAIRAMLPMGRSPI